MSSKTAHVDVAPDTDAELARCLDAPSCSRDRTSVPVWRCCWLCAARVEESILVIVAVSKEEPGERRIAMTPQVASRLVAAGHGLVVESGLGNALGFSDDAYKDAGAVAAHLENCGPALGQFLEFAELVKI